MAYTIRASDHRPITLKEIIDTIDTSLKTMSVTATFLDYFEYESGANTLWLGGRAMTGTEIKGKTYPANGQVNKLAYEEDGARIFTLSRLKMDSNDLSQAVYDEVLFNSPKAQDEIEDLFLTRSLRYFGNDAAEDLRPGDTLSNGQPFTLSGNDKAWLGKGRDRFAAGDGDDILRGQGGNDRLWGEKGDDILIGGRGADRLSGGEGNDTMTGGKGSDRFVFTGSATGDDTISDFTDGVDLIELDFANVETIEQAGDDTLITHEQGSITLQDFLATDLTAADFA